MMAPEDFTPCDLTTCSSTAEETVNIQEVEPIFSVLTGGMKAAGGTVSAGACGGGGAGGGCASPTAAATSDTESGIFSVESEVCVEHESELDWFCGTEQRLICSRCATVGPCRGHAVAPLASRVTSVRVHLPEKTVALMGYNAHNTLQK